MDASVNTIRRTGWLGAAETIINTWAIVGGFMVVAVVLMNVWTVIGGIIGVPFSGDFELTQIGIAIAAFAFLPYCQLVGANVTADIFTARASPFWIAIFALAASIVAFLFAALLLWRMYEGMGSQREYGYTTAILQVPIWWAYLPCLLSLALLVLAAAITLLENLGKSVRGGR